MIDPSYSGILNIVHTLLPKTQLGQAVWQTDGEELTLRMPVATVSLKANAAGPDQDPEYRLSVSLPEGRPLGVATFGSQDPDYKLVKQLHQSATQASWDELGKEIARLASEEEILGTTTTTTPPPDLPLGPNKEQTLEFFGRIRGDWNLDFTRGKEVCRIDGDGNYFVLKPQHEGTVARPKFRLELLAFTGNYDRVEMAKVELDGRTKQIEVLDVTSDRMTGHAKHDLHPLKYVRK